VQTPLVARILSNAVTDDNQIQNYFVSNLTGVAWLSKEREIQQRVRLVCKKE
jgi:hypothetical protein